MVTGLVLALVLGAVGPTHPMHTSGAELYQSATGTVSIGIRIFEDDLISALGTGPKPPDSTMFRYVREHFALTERNGRQLSLEWSSAERTGGMVLLQLHTRVADGLRGARVMNDILCDRFHDQVNIVRASYAGGTATLLFTAGDGPKAIP